MNIYKSMSDAKIGTTWNKIIIPGTLMLAMIKVGEFQMMIHYVNFIDMPDDANKVVRTTTTVTTIEASLIYESYCKNELTWGE